MRVAVIGVGKLGSIHLRIYRELNQVGTVYIVDELAGSLKNHPDIIGFTDYRKVLGKVDMVSIATPTHNHFKIAKFFLENKVPVLVEKPLTQNLKEAKELLKIAVKNKTLVCVGHVERYNNAYLAIKKIIKNPLFIECHRLSPYPYRSLDISVVLDLMIHDLDIIQYLVKSPVKKIEAKGVKVLSKSQDIANARITFANGCVANVTSSRISAKKERKIRIFMHNSYISMDYAEQQALVYRKEGSRINQEIMPIDKGEPLKNEITHFVELVRKKSFTIEYAQKATEALELALKVQKAMAK